MCNCSAREYRNYDSVRPEHHRRSKCCGKPKCGKFIKNAFITSSSVTQQAAFVNTATVSYSQGYVIGVTGGVTGATTLTGLI